MLVNFTRVQKYNPLDPAWFNTIALDLQNKAKVDNKPPTLFLQHYLNYSKGNLDELKRYLGILVTVHPHLPLVIFNYDHVKTPHDSLIGLECRGLVLEKDTWQVVAKPMNRFFNWNEIDIENAPHPNLDKRQFNFKSFVTQSKEDGSLMVLFFYQGHWMLNTRTFFLNGQQDRRVVMSGIHEIYASKVIEVFLSGLSPEIKELDDLDKYLDREHTYSFELCAQINKIVRNYEQDSVYLLTITRNYDFKELSTEEVDQAAAKIQAKRPKDYQLETLETIVEYMKELTVKDPSLEGFVIRDSNGSRWKIKSHSYFFLHHISYDKMRTPYPRDLIPLILQGEGTELFSILELNGFTAELYEVQQQWKFCEERLAKGWEQLKNDWEHMQKIENKKDFEKEIRQLKTPLTKLIELMFKEGKTDLEDLEKMWNENGDLLVACLFSKEEQNPANARKAEVRVEHISGYKKVELKKEKEALNPIFKKGDWWKYVNEENDGLAKEKPQFKDEQWAVKCFCGKRMQLYSVPEHWFNYKCARAPDCNYCKESMVEKKKQQGLLQNKGGNSVMVYQCECGLSHQAHQHQKKIDNELKRRPLKGKPVGVPCSELCLCMRHLAHEELDIVMKEFQWDRDQVYKEIAKMLDVNSENSHVGVLGISQCREVIAQFRDMRGAE